MENEIKERKEREYFIIHINYSTNKYYVYMYHRFRKFTINQAWNFINDGFDNPVLLSTYIESFGNINNKTEEEILQEITNLYFDPREEKNPLKKTVILKTLVLSDDEGNDIKKVYPNEEKYDNDFNKLIEKIVDEKAPADSVAIQQEDSDKEKDIIKEDFVKFEEILKKSTFKIIPFKGEFKLTEEFIVNKGQMICDEYGVDYGIDDLKFVFLDFLIYDFFPDSTIKFEEDKKSLNIETRLGTVFILRPLDWKSRRCEYAYLHHYDVSLCIF